MSCRIPVSSYSPPETFQPAKNSRKAQEPEPPECIRLPPKDYNLPYIHTTSRLAWYKYEICLSIPMEHTKPHPPKQNPESPTHKKKRRSVAKRPNWHRRAAYSEVPAQYTGGKYTLSASGHSLSINRNLRLNHMPVPDAETCPPPAQMPDDTLSVSPGILFYSPTLSIKNLLPSEHTVSHVKVARLSHCSSKHSQFPYETDIVPRLRSLHYQEVPVRPNVLRLPDNDLCARLPIYTFRLSS